MPAADPAAGGLRLAVLAGATLLAAGCDGGAKSPSVASFGTTPSSNSSDSAASSSPGFPSSGDFPAGSSMSMQVGTAGVKYTACMRAHGVPKYPDPDAHGVITITISTSLSPTSPLFQKAEGDCGHLIPAEKGLSAAKQQQLKARMLAFAACMRSHGVPNYLDPTFGSGGVIQRSGNNGMDPNSPIFEAAQKTCQSNRFNSG